MTNWWDEQIRAVTLEFPAADVATIDVKGIVDETHRGDTNTLNVVFSTGYYPGGTAFYQSRDCAALSRIGRTRSAGGRDRSGARQWSEGWSLIWLPFGGIAISTSLIPIGRSAKPMGGSPLGTSTYNSVAMDPLSPYREYFASIVKEIADNYACRWLLLSMSPASRVGRLASACQPRLRGRIRPARCRRWSAGTIRYFMKFMILAQSTRSQNGAARFMIVAKSPMSAASTFRARFRLGVVASGVDRNFRRAAACLHTIASASASPGMCRWRTR